MNMMSQRRKTLIGVGIAFIAAGAMLTVYAIAYRWPGDGKGARGTNQTAADLYSDEAVRGNDSADADEEGLQVLRTDSEMAAVTDPVIRGLYEKRIPVEDIEGLSSSIIAEIHFFSNALDGFDMAAKIDRFTQSLKSVCDILAPDDPLWTPEMTYSLLEILRCYQSAKSDNISKEERSHLRLLANKCLREIRSPVRTYVPIAYYEKAYMNVYKEEVKADGLGHHGRFIGLFKVGKLLSEVVYAAKDIGEVMNAVSLYSTDISFLNLFHRVLVRLRSSCAYEVIVPELDISTDVLKELTSELTYFYEKLKKMLETLFRVMNECYSKKKTRGKEQCVEDPTGTKIIPDIEKVMKFFFKNCRFKSPVFRGPFTDATTLNFGSVRKKNHDLLKTLAIAPRLAYREIFKAEDNLSFAYNGYSVCTSTGLCAKSPELCSPDKHSTAKKSPAVLMMFLTFITTIQELNSTSLSVIMTKFFEIIDRKPLRKSFIACFDCSVDFKTVDAVEKIFDSRFEFRCVDIVCHGKVTGKRIVIPLEMRLTLPGPDETKSYNYQITQFLYDKSRGQNTNVVLIQGIEANGELAYYKHERGSICRVDPGKYLKQYENYMFLAEYSIVENNCSESSHPRISN